MIRVLSDSSLGTLELFGDRIYPPEFNAVRKPSPYPPIIYEWMKNKLKISYFGRHGCAWKSSNGLIIHWNDITIGIRCDRRRLWSVERCAPVYIRDGDGCDTRPGLLQLWGEAWASEHTNSDGRLNEGVHAQGGHRVVQFPPGGKGGHPTAVRCCTITLYAIYVRNTACIYRSRVLSPRPSNIYIYIYNMDRRTMKNKGITDYYVYIPR